MTVLQMQALLIYLGYAPGGADGVQGPKTRQAMAAFQRDHRVPSQEEIPQALLAAVAAEEVPASFWEAYPNFQKSEFRCPCQRCGGYPAEPREELAALLQDVRDHFGRPVGISSGVRCERHNAEVGGVSNSRHLLGKAADFSVSGVESSRVLCYCQTLVAAGRARYAYAIDESFVHMDIQ